MFCAYPPLYQGVLAGWMWVFGTSVIAAMALHLVLFGGYMLLLLGLLRRLRAPAWAAGIAGAFLLVMTFHDRPDSLAHLLGIGAVYCWVCGRPVWAAGLAILASATSLQLGALYSLLLWLGMLGQGLSRGARLPVGPMVAMAAVPAALAGMVALGFPHVWAGFMEHARQTPSLTGWRWPRLHEALKIARNAPGIPAAAVLLPWVLSCRSRTTSQETQHLKSDRISGAGAACDEWEASTVTAASTLAALAVVGASLFLLAPSSVQFVGPLQPLIVGGCLALAAARPWQPRRLAACAWLFLALAAIGSIRAIGMSTWGVACAADAGYPSALRHVRAELKSCAAGSTAVLSSAYLYEAARHSQLKCIHSDWMEPPERGRPSADWDGLTALKPARLILTQFDYYRRYQPLLQRLKTRADLAEVQIVNTARLPAPDSFPSLQKALQHISWAPVVATIRWNSTEENGGNVTEENKGNGEAQARRGTED